MLCRIPSRTNNRDGRETVIRRAFAKENVDRDWFDAVFLRVQKKIRQRHLQSAIFLAPPPTQHKTLDLLNIGLPLVHEAESTAKVFLGETY